MMTKRTDCPKPSRRVKSLAAHYLGSENAPKGVKSVAGSDLRLGRRKSGRKSSRRG